MSDNLNNKLSSVAIVWEAKPREGSWQENGYAAGQIKFDLTLVGGIPDRSTIVVNRGKPQVSRSLLVVDYDRSNASQREWLEGKMEKMQRRMKEYKTGLVCLVQGVHSDLLEEELRTTGESFGYHNAARLSCSIHAVEGVTHRGLVSLSALTRKFSDAIGKGVFDVEHQKFVFCPVAMDDETVNFKGNFKLCTSVSNDEMAVILYQGMTVFRFHSAVLHQYVAEMELHFANFRNKSCAELKKWQESASGGSYVVNLKELESAARVTCNMLDQTHNKWYPVIEALGHKLAENAHHPILY